MVQLLVSIGCCFFLQIFVGVPVVLGIVFSSFLAIFEGERPS